MKILILAALAASFLTIGCATPQTTATNERAEEPEVLTGSRIPRRSAPTAATTSNAEGTRVISGQGYKTEQMGRSADGVGMKGN